MSGKKLKSALVAGFGAACGTALYSLITQSFNDIDWFRSLFVGAFCAFVFIVIGAIQFNSN